MIVVYTRINIKTIILVQRNRNIRKVITPPSVVGDVNVTNIQRMPIKQEAKHSRTDYTNINFPKQTIKETKVSKFEKIEYHTVSRDFEGETVYIIGGGPSLKDFDFNRLNGAKTIAINKAVLFYPKADVLYWTDVRFYTWHKDEIDNYKGLKFCIKTGSQYSNNIKILKKGKLNGLETDPQTLAHGNNSGYAAINLAYHLGAARIILLGFDMGNVLHNNKMISHFHDGYPTRPANDKMYLDKFIPGFSKLKSDLLGLGITVLNASTYSRLNVFPKITIEQALSFR